MTDQALLHQLHHCPDDAVAADVLVKLWRAGPSLRAEALRGFVITTARNLAVDRWRQLRRRAEVPLFDVDGEDSAFLEQEHSCTS